MGRGVLIGSFRQRRFKLTGRPPLKPFRPSQKNTHKRGHATVMKNIIINNNKVNCTLLLCALGLISTANANATASATATADFNKETFLAADKNAYTRAYCRSIRSRDFLNAIHSLSPTEPRRRSAFEAFFEGCREEFLASELALDYAVYLLLTGNEEFLGSLLEFRDGKALPLTDKDLRDLGTTIFMPAAASAAAAQQQQQDRLFALDRPHRVLATLLEHSRIIDSNPAGRLKTLQTYVSGHWAYHDQTYHDLSSVDMSVALLGHYIAHPEDLGARRTTIVERIEREYGGKRGGGSGWVGWAAVMVGLAAVVAVGAVVLRRYAVSMKGFKRVQE